MTAFKDPVQLVVYEDLSRFFISTSIKLPLSTKKIAILLRLRSGGHSDSYPTTMYRPWSTLWRKWALIKPGKLPHKPTKTRRAGKSLQMMSVQSSPGESSCWWAAGWLMPAGSRGPPPEHWHRQCSTYQFDTAKVLHHYRQRLRTLFHRSKSATLLPAAATSHRTASSVAFLTSRHHIHFRDFAGQSTLNRLAPRSALTHRNTAHFYHAQRCSFGSKDTETYLPPPVPLLIVWADFQINAFGLVCAGRRAPRLAGGLQKLASLLLTHHG